MRKFAAILSNILIATGFIALAEAPVNYYSSCEGLNQSALLSKLCTVVGPHTTVSYDGLWDVYEDSDVDANGKIWDMYSTKRWTVGKEKCGNYSKVGDCINREHSFPKSWFDDKSPMKSDAFHVYPTDGKVNGQRSNYPYGECSGGTTLPSSGGVQALGRLGTSTFSGYSGKVFEPVDEYKGDFARTYFYMAAAYNTKIASWSSPMLAGNSYPAYTSWAVNLLLKWHRQDPVSQKELDRNEAVYKHQRNRNPFIDNPEMAEYIWGDKKSEKWYEDEAPTPSLSQPSNDTSVSFGTVAVGYQVSRYINIKGANLTAPLTVSVSEGSEFAISATTITAAAAMSGSGVSVTLRPTSTGEKTATLTVASATDGINAVVNLTATAIDGIPALAATNITETGFTANWTDLSDADTYTLTVSHDGQPIEGYPIDVTAALEEYDVENLTPATTYTYQLRSAEFESNVVTVTTLAPTPSIQYIESASFSLSTEPGEPSQYVEVELFVENINDAFTVEVDAPFQVSTDCSNWSKSIEMQPLDDRFYLRVNSEDQGEYESTILIEAGEYVNDEGVVNASVRSNSEPWFYEDFEDLGDQKVDDYNNKTITGRVSVWNIVDCGVWGDTDKRGKYSLRFGKSATSSLTSATIKSRGIGMISFYLSRWSSSDGDITIAIEYSPDGKDFTTAATITCSSDALQLYEIPVNVSGDNYIRFRQTSGKRGNIDDIYVTDYTSGVEQQLSDTESWTAYSLNGELVVENSGDARVFSVFSVEGITYVDQMVERGAAAFKLPAGLYIVTDNTTARRVLVK